MISLVCLMQIWDLDELLQHPGNNLEREAAAADNNDSDEMEMDMDMEVNPPKSNKGISFWYLNNYCFSIFLLT